MPRLQLFEFNDQPWLPAVLRDGATGYLEALSRKMGFHQLMVPVVADVLERSSANQIVDLCSGGGGPMLYIQSQMESRPRLVLTDKYPNQAVFSSIDQDNVSARMEPVDATEVPEDLRGLRTIVNALHHFPPTNARKVLADAARRREPLVMIELTERTWLNILTSPLIVLFTLLFMPTVRPMRWQYLLFTYLIPILPLLIFWDGLVSHLRAYTVAELEAMTHDLDAGYTWETRHLAMGPGARATVLVGMPSADSERAHGENPERAHDAPSS